MRRLLPERASGNFMKTRFMAPICAAAAVATALVALPAADATPYLGDNPPGCVGGNGVECGPGAGANAGPGGAGASVPGAAATAGPGGTSATVPGANVNAGPGFFNACVSGFCIG
jgi:hypothetical protein